jgi:lipopolysaccharide/colanic/teichoic acid biosynthesis glycosyltransferase
VKRGSPTRRQESIKRTIDFILALIALTLLFPLILAIALLIKLTSRGPVFFRGLRVGRRGVPFRMFKFRTMIPDADRRGGYSTADDDPRITRFGKVLRRYKLDEIPQLINILKGEMSFVGPRPEVQHYVNLFTDEEREILSVRPGITDWASLRNPDEGSILAGSPNPDKTYLEEIRPEKLRLQLEYVRRRTLATDLQILVRTLEVVFLRRRHGAGSIVEREK